MLGEAITRTKTMTISNNKITEQIIRLMQADDSVDAPRESLKGAKNIFRSRITEPKRSLAQKVMAVLRMDLSPQKAAFGERSGSAAQARQMLFEAGENSIDLRIREAENGWEIHGQILGAGFAGGTIELSNKEKSYTARATNESEFKLKGIARGKYNFAARNNERELLIEGLELT
jgi:hypothetical protein